MEKSYSQNIERLIYYATPGRWLCEWPLVAYQCSIEIVAQQNKRRTVFIGVVVDELLKAERQQIFSSTQ